MADPPGWSGLLKRRLAWQQPITAKQYERFVSSWEELVNALGDYASTVTGDALNSGGVIKFASSFVWKGVVTIPTKARGVVIDGNGFITVPNYIGMNMFSCSASNVRFKNIIAYPGTSAFNVPWGTMLTVSNAENIQIIDCVFHGTKLLTGSLFKSFISRNYCVSYSAVTWVNIASSNFVMINNNIFGFTSSDCIVLGASTSSCVIVGNNLSGSGVNSSANTGNNLIIANIGNEFSTLNTTDLTAYQTIQDEGSNVTRRSKLNFVGAGVAVTDDSGNDRTIVTIGGTTIPYIPPHYGLLSVRHHTTGLTDLQGFNAISNMGTTTARPVATTNLFTRMVRTGRVSGTVSGNTCGLVMDDVATSVDNGFRLRVEFGISDAVFESTGTTFVGLNASASTWSGTLTTKQSIVGIGNISGDTEFSLITNDNIGNPVFTSLGVNFPCNTTDTDWYRLELTCSRAIGDIDYQVTRLNTGDVVSGTISGNVPVSFISPTVLRITGAAVAVGIDCGYIELIRSLD